ncbi:FAD-binding protein [Nostoc sp.]|uniref:FAD-binding protein n=1 Tax=Nostoc sp. TaxID=1180 RepID=UPI002FFC54A5
MSTYQSESGNSSTSQLNLETDVLVIGGGLSATWATWNAAAQGVRRILVDKGYCGTTGATAPSGNGFLVDDEGRPNRRAIRSS